jgi:hypothetical protein
MKAATKANIFLLIGAIAGVLISIGIITYSIMQNFDVKTVDSYNGEFCEDSVLKEHRPFQVYLSLTSTSNVNATNYKICSVMLPNKHRTNETIECYYPKLPHNKDGNINKKQMTVFCSWSPHSQVRRIGITASQFVILIFVILWIIFAARIWGKLLGLIYMILSALTIAGMFWILIKDASALRSSRNWCKGYYQHSLCNPYNYLNPDMKCECDYLKYLGTVMLDAMAVLVFIYVTVCCILRFVAYRYREDENYQNLDALAEVNEEENDNSGYQQQSENPNEKRAREIYSSYGYK